MILLMTIVHATIGSFVIYIVLTDLFGPSEPTKLIDGLLRWLIKCGKKGETKDAGTDDLVLTKEDNETAEPYAANLGMGNNKEIMAQSDHEVEVTLGESQTKYDLGNKERRFG